MMQYNVMENKKIKKRENLKLSNVFLVAVWHCFVNITLSSADCWWGFVSFYKLLETTDFLQYPWESKEYRVKVQTPHVPLHVLPILSTKKEVFLNPHAAFCWKTTQKRKGTALPRPGFVSGCMKCGGNMHNYPFLPFTGTHTQIHTGIKHKIAIYIFKA